MTIDAVVEPAVAQVNAADALGTPAVPATVAAIPAAAEPAVVEDPAKPDGVVAYESTGNARVDYALDIIGKAGLGSEDPAVIAAIGGDFTMLQHALEAKGTAGVGPLIQMLKEEHESDQRAQEATLETIKEDVVRIAGSPEQWDAVAAFVRENGDEAELNTLRGMLGDPLTHKIAAGYMVSVYNQAGGEREPTARVESENVAARTAKAADTGTITRAELAQRGQVLYRKYGDSYVNSPEYRALASRLA